ncbi:MAG: PAS domain S-box protein [Xanthobacteraceae bacterium]
MARIVGTLYPGGTPRLERFRGFTPAIGQAIVCACSRIVVDGTAAILVAAQEPAGIDLSLAARIEFLLAGSDEAMAAFTTDGELVAATPSGRATLGPAKTASTIGAGSLATAALAEGTATGETRSGRATMVRVGHDNSTALIAIFLAASREPKHTSAGPGLKASAIDEAPAVEPGPLHIEQPPPDRRAPLRFVWQMDRNGRFTLGSDEFIEAIGSRTAVVLGRPWNEIAAELDLDPDHAVMRAIETRDTWSGIVVSFPIDNSDERVQVELSGLPVYDRGRAFLGYRGFGVCRDVERLTRLGWVRRAPAFPAFDAVPTSAVAQAAPDPPAKDDVARDDVEPILALLQRTGGDLAIGPDPVEEEAGGEWPPSGSARPENVLLFPAAAPDAKSRMAAPLPPPPTALSVGEHDAFQEIARRLQARLASDPACDLDAALCIPGDTPAAAAARDPAENGDAAAKPTAAEAGAFAFTAFLNALPVGLMVYRYDQPLYANHAFLTATGFSGLEDLIQAGGLDSLEVGIGASVATGADEAGQALTIVGRDRTKAPIAARLVSVPWTDENALALVLQPAVSDHNKRTELALRRCEAHIRELRAIVENGFDGLIVLSRQGVVLSANRRAGVLFGYQPAELLGRHFRELFAPQSRGAALEYLDQVHRDGRFVADGREVEGQSRQGQEIPLSVILGNMPDGADKVYAAFRDLAPRGKTEASLSVHKEDGKPADADPSDLLKTLGTNIRDGLGSITGAADLMLEECFGPLGNERYRGCLRDIHAASDRIAGLVDNIRNLSRAESGTLDLNFVPVDFNVLVQGCVKTLQSDANRDRIIIRSSLSPGLRPVLADAQSLQQVVGNLLAKAIRHAGTGGQVIVSTAETERGHVVLRVRDTGAASGWRSPDPAGRTPKDAPPLPNASRGASVDMVLTRTLAEANHGTLHISSKANEGTLFEVSFPGARIPAE